MAKTNCILDETYGAIREIEDEIILQKRGDWKWGLDGPDCVEQTLFSSAFLLSIGQILTSNQIESIRQLTELADDDVSKSSEMFHAFSVGLASCVLVSEISMSKAIRRLINKIEGTDSLPKHHQTSILFGLSLFKNLVDAHDDGKLMELENLVVDRVREIVEDFAEDRFQSSRIQFLYVLSSFQKCEDILKDLHKNYRKDVEILRKARTKSDEKVLLLRPFSILNVDCHRSIIGEIMDGIRKNEYSHIQKNILHRISLFFSYSGQTDCEVDLGMTPDNEVKSLNIGIDEKDLKALEGLPLNAKQNATIGIGFVTSGFHNVYIVPMSERRQYIQFKRSHDMNQHSIIRTTQSREMSENWANTKYNNQLGIALVKLSLVLVVAYFLYLVLQNNQLISVIASSSIPLIYLIIQASSTFGKAISANSRSFVPLLYNHKKIKEELSREFLARLGL